MQIRTVRKRTIITAVTLAIAIGGCATLFWVGDGQLVCRVPVGDHTELVAVKDQNGNIVMAQNQSPELLTSVCTALNGTPAPSPPSGVAGVKEISLSGTSIPPAAVKRPEAVRPQIVIQGKAPVVGTPPITGAPAPFTAAEPKAGTGSY